MINGLPISCLFGLIRLLINIENVNAHSAFDALKNMPGVLFKENVLTFPRQSIQSNQSEISLVGSATLDPIVNICDDGLLDIVLQHQDGRITLFKDYHFYELEIKNDLVSSMDNGTLTSLVYKEFPVRSRFAFTVIDSISSLNGLSFLFRNQLVYLYNDTQHMGKLSLDYWSGYSSKFDGIISERNSTVIAFVSSSYDSAGLIAESRFKIFNVIDPRAADAYERFYPPENDFIFYYLKAAMKLKDGRWLAFLQLDEIGYYCLATKLRLSHCRLVKLSSLFNCPPVLKSIRESLLLPTPFWLPSMDQDRFLFVLRGILISVLFIESVFITFLFHLLINTHTRRRLAFEVIKSHKSI